jgi:hypothetical protein
LSTIVISKTLAAGNEPIAPLPVVVDALHVEFTPVLPDPKSTATKFASGATPPPEGASAIHSADDRFALFILVDVLNPSPVVTSVNITVNLPRYN